jgi:hypothetical protein
MSPSPLDIYNGEVYNGDERGSEQKCCQVVTYADKEVSMAVDIFVTITGEKQGQFKGQSQDQAFQGKGAVSYDLTRATLM